MNGSVKGPKWAVYHCEHFWLTDTCASGAWSETVEEALWFDSREEARDALVAAEILYNPDEYTVCRVR